MNVLCVASEMAPFAKTGGLADVMAALPRQLVRSGHDVRVFLPLYDTAKVRGADLVTVVDGFEVALGPHRYGVKIVSPADDPLVHFVHCPALYGRGGLYTSDDDEHRRFLALGWAALMGCQRMGFAPDIIHGNDWQSGFLPLTLDCRFRWDRLFARTRTLLTIHNLNYQGVFAASMVPDTNLADSAHLFHQDQLREGRVNSLLHGILYADGISTVSPTYSQEIQSADGGAGLDPFLRARSSTVIGILNGVDYDEWSPERDRHIPHRYSPDDLAGKERDKQDLLGKMGLPYQAGVPLIGMISRLAGQKGLELVGEVMPRLLRRHGFQMVILGSGESRLELMFSDLQRAFPRQVGFYRGFLEPLAHLIEAGADMFLMPSRYEPCGLNQMYSLRYGTVPIVHKTGGLADTVKTWSPASGAGNGFAFEQHDAAGLTWGVEAALATFRDRAAWARLMQNGMAEDFSWSTQARLYEQVYQRLRASA